jgi:ferredoxin-thioredoxin reductase catalytic subunit
MMADNTDVLLEEVERLYEKLYAEAEAGGYHLNPDKAMTRRLLNGLLINEKRYGYPSCPCRLASGNKDDDLDIICPCDYRDPDIDDYNACYCSLYVSRAAVEGRVKIGSIPERRPPRDKRLKMKTEKKETTVYIETTSSYLYFLSLIPLPPLKQTHSIRPYCFVFERGNK